MAVRTQTDFLSSGLTDGPVLHTLDGAGDPPQPLVVLDFPSKFWSLLVSPLVCGLVGAAVAFAISYIAIHSTVGKLQERLDATEAALRSKADAGRVQDVASDLRSELTLMRSQVTPLSSAMGDHGARISRDEADISGLKGELTAHAKGANQSEIKIQYLEKQLAELDHLRNEVNALKLRLLGR